MANNNNFYPQNNVDRFCNSENNTQNMLAPLSNLQMNSYTTNQINSNVKNFNQNLNMNLQNNNMYQNTNINNQFINNNNNNNINNNYYNQFPNNNSQFQNNQNNSINNNMNNGNRQNQNIDNPFHMASPNQIIQNNQLQNPYKPHDQLNINSESQNNNNFDKNNKKYTLITCGNKFSTNDLNIIIDSSYEELIRKKNPLSKYIIQRIKNILGGDWVVFICVDGLKGYDLSISCNDENRLISFVMNNFRFQIIKIAD